MTGLLQLPMKQENAADVNSSTQAKKPFSHAKIR